MKTNFLEWMKAKEELLNEGRRQAQADYQVEGIPQIGDVVISNPAAFFKKVLYVPRGRGSDAKIPKLRDGVNISPADFSSFNIQNMDDNVASATRQTSGTYSSKGQGDKEVFKIKRLRDVSDSFDNAFMGDSGKKYFVDLGRGKSVEGLYKVYQQLTRHSSLGDDPNARQNLAMTNFLGGDDQMDNKDRTHGQQAAANLVNKGANDAVRDYKSKLNDKIKAWIENPAAYLQKTGQSMPQIISGLQSELKQLHEDPEDSQWYDSQNKLPYIQSKWLDKIDPSHASWDAGQESDMITEPVPSASPLDALMQGKGPSVNPAAASAAGQYSGQHQQQDDAIRNLLKTASYDPSIMSNTRCWKRHDDVKRYAYFSEANMISVRSKTSYL